MSSELVAFLMLKELPGVVEAEFNPTSRRHVYTIDIIVHLEPLYQTRLNLDFVSLSLVSMYLFVMLDTSLRIRSFTS